MEFTNIIIIIIIIVILAVVIYFGYNYFTSKQSKFMTQVPIDSTLNVVSQAEKIEEMALKDAKRYEEIGIQQIHLEEKEKLEKAAQLQKQLSATLPLDEASALKAKQTDDEMQLALKQLNDKYEIDMKYAGEQMKLTYDQLIRRIAHDNYVRGLPYPRPLSEDQNIEVDKKIKEGTGLFNQIKVKYNKDYDDIISGYKVGYENIKKAAIKKEKEKVNVLPLSNIGKSPILDTASGLKEISQKFMPESF